MSTKLVKNAPKYLKCFQKVDAQKGVSDYSPDKEIIKDQYYSHILPKWSEKETQIISEEY